MSDRDDKIIKDIFFVSGLDSIFVGNERIYDVERLNLAIDKVASDFKETLTQARKEGMKAGMRRAAEIALTIRFDRMGYSDDGGDMRITHIGCGEISEAITKEMEAL